MANDANILLRLPTKMKEQLQAEAKKSHQSLNAYLLTRLQSKLNPQPLESQFIGQTVSGLQIDTINGLITVQGILYRCVIEDNYPLKATEKYVILDVTGNILTLRHLSEA